MIREYLSFLFQESKRFLVVEFQDTKKVAEKVREIAKKHNDRIKKLNDMVSNKIHDITMSRLPSDQKLRKIATLKFKAKDLVRELKKLRAKEISKFLQVVK